MTEPHGLTGVPDVGAFLARLTRLDPGAVVRLRAVGADRTVLWGRLPWAVLVGRAVAGAGPADATVGAAELLAEVARGGAALPARRDQQWRWPLPPPAGPVVETVSAAEVRQVAEAAAGTLRTAATEGVGGRAVGQRMLRDALLDHVAVVVTGPGVGRIEVPQRLVQAIVRMGFLGPAEEAGEVPVHVRIAGRWIGLSAPYGVAWLPPVSTLAVRMAGTRPNG
ncbi:hypothetical protein SAMN05444365_11437 [Micromonospora pattaloongensis]|uniref:Uncharacterized protein n=1 Tax=Micromonospora pattaloongensis TaxID=405436 RepID=A0A1H3SV91_9ACTN|nr:hypothetical protein [Micromonospora pattaloongensis]SDZ41445.1 hypothetical protein SAMN05444365_11437 [Micromonospora pattaloongensis]